MVVANWLKPSPRSASDFSFEVIDVVESSLVPSPTELADLMAESYWGLEYLADLAERYWCGNVQDIFQRARGGAKTSVKRGDWGEAVTVDYIKSVEGYLVPVPKLRYKIGANQTLPGSDCVALRLTDGTLSEVVFVESKLRTNRDSSVAVDGASQLMQDAENENPEILPFIARQLRRTNDPLTEVFEAYLFDRNTAPEKYILILLHEADSWDELALRNLEDKEMGLKPLHVYVAKIANLKELTDRTFAEMGGEAIEGDE